MGGRRPALSHDLSATTVHRSALLNPGFQHQARPEDSGHALFWRLVWLHNVASVIAVAGAMRLDALSPVLVAVIARRGGRTAADHAPRDGV